MCPSSGPAISFGRTAGIHARSPSEFTRSRHRTVRAARIRSTRPVTHIMPRLAAYTSTPLPFGDRRRAGRRPAGHDGARAEEVAAPSRAVASSRNPAVARTRLRRRVRILVRPPACSRFRVSTNGAGVRPARRDTRRVRACGRRSDRLLAQAPSLRCGRGGRNRPDGVRAVDLAGLAGPVPRPDRGPHSPDHPDL